ncbi:hypothetical protein D9V29_01565 [Mycetocola manganoxydans]|uniref:Uncharacterized protein n=1 Tax=Mycetocola manganoxydans TaxID=699879 RepID=A0A3L7A001_9MICO|nr:hypothetical protein [Mycetocola manganoxydans]RLP73404.1 hypothetical protein D9V29_01565 [Mycetocola manganoxydans]GHD41881.1 hypothetical protein GCM10008097_07180 [Mycetocola manganoxydans]
MTDHTEHPDSDSDEPGTNAAGSPDASFDVSPEEVVPVEADEVEASGGGTGQRTTQAQLMSDDDRSRFQDHWDEFPGH